MSAEDDAFLAKLVLHEDWSVGIGGGVWSTGVAMAKYMFNNSSFLTKRLSGRRCLELGSGNGWLSVVLAILVKDCTIHITDDEAHLPLMSETIENNKHLIEDISRVKVEKLLWGVTEAPSEKYDFVFGTDVAYRDHLHDPLIKALRQCLKRDGTCLIGVCMSDTTVQFFDKLTTSGFRYERLSDLCMPKEQRGPTFGLIVVEWDV